MQGKAWAPICRAAANLGVRARGWETGEISGEYRGRALREEGDESGKWGPRVSECGERRERHERASERAAGADVLGPGGRGGPRAGRC